jgi:hypothetical protein
MFPFQFNKMSLNCHTKPPRLDETSDLIRTTECTRVSESVDGYQKIGAHISVLSVINREYGTTPACAGGWQG